MVKIAGYTITGVTKYKLEYDNPALKFLDKLVEKKGETRKRLITDIEYCIGKHAFTRPKPGDCDMHAIYPSKYNKYRYTTGKYTVIYYVSGTNKEPSIRIHEIFVKGNKSHNSY
mgnify:FL=1